MNKKWHKWTDDVIKADVQPLVDASHQSCCRLYGQCIHSAEPSHREGLLWAGLLLKRLAQFDMPDGQADGGMCFEVLPLFCLRLVLREGVVGVSTSWLLFRAFRSITPAIPVFLECSSTSEDLLPGTRVFPKLEFAPSSFLRPAHVKAYLAENRFCEGAARRVSLCALERIGSVGCRR